MMDILPAVPACLITGSMFRQRAMVVRAIFRLPTGMPNSRDGPINMFSIRQQPVATALPAIQALEIMPGLNNGNRPCYNETSYPSQSCPACDFKNSFSGRGRRPLGRLDPSFICRGIARAKHFEQYEFCDGQLRQLDDLSIQ